jgi:hypothetical protein
MWLFTRHGFFSVVRYKKRVAIRARDWAHLDNLRSWMGINSKILELTGTDYRFRIMVSRTEWRRIAARLAEEAEDVVNFKDEAKSNVALVGATYIGILHRIWSMVAGEYDPPARRQLTAVEYDHGQSTKSRWRNGLGSLRSGLSDF